MKTIYQWNLIQFEKMKPFLYLLFLLKTLIISCYGQISLEFKDHQFTRDEFQWRGKKEVDASGISQGLTFSNYDFNENGIYDDPLVDLLYANHKQTLQRSICTISDTNTLMVDNEYFLVQLSSGKLKVTKVDSFNREPEMRIFEKLPSNLQFFDLQSEQKFNIDSLIQDSSQLYILSFWYSFCRPCIIDLGMSKIYNKYAKNKIKFIFICNENDKEHAREKIQKVNPEGIQLYGSEKTFTYLNIYGFPTGILLKGNREIITYFEDLNGLFNHLKKIGMN